MIKVSCRCHYGRIAFSLQTVLIAWFAIALGVCFWANSKPGVDITPSPLDLGLVSVGEHMSLELFVINRTSADIRIYPGSTTGRVEFEKRSVQTIQRNSRARITVIISPRGYPSEEVREVVELFTDVPSKPRILVEIRYSIPSRSVQRQIGG
jgi:uncharacterized protein (DUF58 family)